MIGGRPTLPPALHEAPGVSVVHDPAEADAALVDVGSLTPAAHGEACRYPLAPRLPLIVISALGVDKAGTDDPYLAEVSRAETAAVEGRDDWCVLRRAPLDLDLVQVARQITEFSTVYGCFGDNPVPWLAFEDVLDVIREAVAAPDRRRGRAYQLTGAEPVRVGDLVGMLADSLDRKAEYHPLDPAHLVEALSATVGWSLDTALRVPHHQHWAGTAHPLSPTVERALGRPPRPVSTCVARAAAAVATPAAGAPEPALPTEEGRP
ncbi:Rossmann-fold NAD(P)-binding domain-containing protein [Allosalinactinospora lopnorensis]|uniref:hypothetical protein n=1 Tax=Allosalinactinospora lopnorensis TaxID=1352348 RepID=UPI000623C3E4|nr:hypothetical protein [Allosalinactinospora lopnorensis]